jgi:hypothetical protein
MSAYLVSYDLDKPGPQNYDRLIAYLEKMKATRVPFSQWIMTSALDLLELERAFMKEIDPSTDSFLTVDLSTGMCAWNKLRVSDAAFKGLLNR